MQHRSMAALQARSAGGMREQRKPGEHEVSQRRVTTDDTAYRTSRIARVVACGTNLGGRSDTPSGTGADCAAPSAAHPFRCPHVLRDRSTLLQ